MIVTRIKRACHGRSVWAEYEMKGFRMDVYVRHNEACKKEYGNLHISCYLKPKNNDLELRDSQSFTDYLSFIKYRRSLRNLI